MAFTCKLVAPIEQVALGISHQVRMDDIAQANELLIWPGEIGTHMVAQRAAIQICDHVAAVQPVSGGQQIPTLIQDEYADKR